MIKLVKFDCDDALNLITLFMFGSFQAFTLKKQNQQARNKSNLQNFLVEISATIQKFFEPEKFLIALVAQDFLQRIKQMDQRFDDFAQIK